jgi:predicted glycosyltransferase
LVRGIAGAVVGLYIQPRRPESSDADEEWAMPTDIADRTQKRAVFFVFDGGTGIGHLRRLARIAEQLQGRFSCLIVTGHRAAAHWFVPVECEYIHLPSWDSLLESKAQYWGRKPFLTIDPAEAVRLRKDIIAGVVRAFAPDVVFVDHLPLGMHEELADVIRDTPCRKYLVTRGVLNETADPDRLILGGKAGRYLSDYYHKVLVASDPKVFDFVERYDVRPEISGKTIHTGYIAASVSTETITATRAERGLETGDIWVVASAGGGQRGEALIRGCLAVARTHPQIVFDIVCGPRSSIRWDGPDRTVVEGGDVRLHQEVRHMPDLHAGADLVITSGGYNSLLETLQGRARILCFPFWRDPRDEQYRHSASLRRFVDIDVSTDLSDLPAMFERTLASIGRGGPVDRRAELDFGGAATIEKIVLQDVESHA